MNGIYWDKQIPRLFELKDIQSPNFKLPVIADITCDEDGSVPCNVGSSTIADPVYGFNRKSLSRCEAFIPGNESLDIMPVDNLPNELPRDASKYFGGFLQTYILPDLISGHNTAVLERATITDNGTLGPFYQYLKDYAGL
jgi:hypothetical protein